MPSKEPIKKNGINLCHLYPEEMNLYGDYGNIIALRKRCEWRDIPFTVTNVGIGDKLDQSKFNFFFMGGGMDIDQTDVFNDLVMNKKGQIEEAVNQDKVFLLICGGYQLFGKYFLTSKGERIEGLGILDVETRGGDIRCIGNIVTKSVFGGTKTTLVGFENHSGLTFLSEGVKPLGLIISGYGNNAQDKTEGAVYKNVYGTYMHGSVLPKNPIFTDHLIKLAIGHHTKLKSLPDNSEQLVNSQLASIL